MDASEVSAGGTAQASEYNNLLHATVPVGAYMPFAGVTIPTNWNFLFAAGQAVSRSTYSDLFAVIVPSLGTFTVTIASPAVFTLSSHGMVAGDPVYLTTSGSLPTGLSVDTIYFVIAAGLTTNAFEVSLTKGGSAINTSVSQSGTHTLRRCPYGLGDGSTTFNVPKLNGAVPIGRDSMGGSDADIVTDADADILGELFGQELKTISIDEIPSAKIRIFQGSSGATSSDNVLSQDNGILNIITSSGDDVSLIDTVKNNATALPNNEFSMLQPSFTANYIIKY